MFKKIKKAFKKVTKLNQKIAGIASGGLVGGDKSENKQAPDMAPPVNQAAAPVEAAPVEAVTDETGEDTESAKKAARARGKKGLSVSRSSGTGVNI